MKGSDGAARRVLIVDDTRANVDLASFVLERAGFVVDAVADPRGLMAAVDAFGPDLILMDIQMPGADGLALARALKSGPATRHIVVVAFTAFAMAGDAARMRDGGCDGYIAKPFDVAAFAGQVSAQMRLATSGP